MSETPQEQQNPTTDTGDQAPEGAQGDAGAAVPPQQDAGGTPPPPAGDGTGEGDNAPADGAAAGTGDQNPAADNGEAGDPEAFTDPEDYADDAGEPQGLPQNVRPGAVSGIDHQPLDGSSTDTADDTDTAESGDTPQG